MGKRLRRRRDGATPSPAPGGWLRRAWARRAVRLGAAALLVLAILGVQVWLYGQPVAVTLPPAGTPGGEAPAALAAVSGVETLVIRPAPRPAAAVLSSAQQIVARTPARGAGLLRIDLEAAVPSPALAALFRLAGEEPPTAPTPMGYRRAGTPEQACPAELRVEMPAATGPPVLWLYQARATDERAGACALQMRLPPGAEVVVESSIGDLASAPCRRQLWSADVPAGFRVDDPLVARFHLPKGDVVRLRFAPRDRETTCRPLAFAPASVLELRRLHWPADALRPSFDGDRPGPSWSVHAALDHQPLDLSPLAVAEGKMTVKPGGVGWVRERGRLVTRNRLEALQGNVPLAKTLGILVQLGLFAWITRVFARSPKEG